MNKFGRRPRPAVAPSGIEVLNERALAQYDELDFDTAAQTLAEAVRRLQAEGRAESPLAAQTYLIAGILHIGGYEQLDRGRREFERALALDPTLQLDPIRGTPQMQAIWDAARQAGAGDAEEAEVALPPPPVLLDDDDNTGIVPPHLQREPVTPHTEAYIRDLVANDAGYGRTEEDLAYYERQLTRQDLPPTLRVAYEYLVAQGRSG